MHFDSIEFALFINIAETGNLTRGAHKSYMSVPAASMRIKGIEDRLGIQLFYRTNQGLRLAPAGHVFLRHGRAVLHQLADLESELGEYAKGTRGSVRILANPTSVNEFLPASLRDYLAENRDINIELREHSSEDVVRSVIEGTADIGFFSSNTSTHDLQVFPYRRFRNVVVVPCGHPLAQANEVDFEQTLEYDYISLIEGARHSYLAQAARGVHKPLKLRIQVNDYEAMCGMVERNVGIAMLPDTAAIRFAAHMNIKLLTLRNPWALREVRICVRDRAALPAAAADLITFLTESSSPAASAWPLPTATAAA
jgi:DNA-binding transcriptional LysR family regulator